MSAPKKAAKVKAVKAWAAFSGNGRPMTLDGHFAIYRTRKDGLRYWAEMTRVLITPAKGRK